jgi:hypothetical protein
MSRRNRERRRRRSSSEADGHHYIKARTSDGRPIATASYVKDGTPIFNVVIGRTLDSPDGPITAPAGAVYMRWEAVGEMVPKLRAFVRDYRPTPMSDVSTDGNSVRYWYAAPIRTLPRDLADHLVPAG